jgi:threonine dehydrogenase-like Zn-dependent dehydrogenase
MTETGRAAVYFDYGQPFEIREIPLPEVEPNAALVRVTTAGICGTDLHMWRGDIRLTAAGPSARILGHEMAGRVYRLGANVKTDSLGQPLKEGDRVIYPYFHPCRRCYQCLRGEYFACPVRYPPPPTVDRFPHFTGAYAEYFYLPPGHFIFKAPEDLPEEMLTPVNCALSQVIFGLRRAGLQFGDTVVIQGAGGLGINATAVAREMGAHQIIVIDGVPERLQLAKDCGADHLIDMNEYQQPSDRITRVKELTGKRGADVVVEVVGLPAVIGEGVEMTRAGGTFLELGNVCAGQTTVEPVRWTWFNRRIVAVNTYDPWILPVALDFLQRTRDKYPIHQVVSHRFPLEQINEAFEKAEWAGRQTAATRVSIVP